jgi:hypothetical protein
MSFFANIFNGIDLGGNSLLILVFFVVGFGYGMLMGKNRLSLVMLAGYFSLIITRAIPWKTFGFFGDKGPDANIQIFIFLAIILAIFFAAPYSGISSVIRVSSRGRSKWWQNLILGVLQLGFLISVIISFVPIKNIGAWNPLIEQFFIGEIARFLWLLFPLAALMALKKKRSYSYGDEE